MRAASDNILRVGLTINSIDLIYGDFRFWHIADVTIVLSDVRFWE